MAAVLVLLVLAAERGGPSADRSRGPRRRPLPRQPRRAFSPGRWLRAPAVPRSTCRRSTRATPGARHGTLPLTHPQLASWLEQRQLMRKLVAIVNNVVEGESPRPHLLFLAPEGRFEVRRSGGLTVVARESYARYDLVAEVVGSVDAEPSGGCSWRSSLWRGGAPGTGPSPGELTQAVGRALAMLLAVPQRLRAGRRSVQVGPLTLYRYVDPSSSRSPRAEESPAHGTAERRARPGAPASDPRGPRAAAGPRASCPAIQQRN